MPQATAMNSTGTNSNGSLHIELMIEEPNVVAYLRTFEEEEVRREKAIEALKVGVIAIRSASPTLDTAVVQEKFSDLEDKMKVFMDDFLKEFQDGLAGYFKDQEGVVPRSINGVFGEDGKLGRTFHQYFDPTVGRLGLLMQQQIGPTSVFGRALDPTNKDGILTQIESRVQHLVERNVGDILGQFSLDNEQSAMCRLQKALDDAFSKIHASLGIKAAVAKEAERGHAKGIEFESALYEPFALFARRPGDETENVGSIPGKQRKKTGDYVATLDETTGAPGTRFVVEVKNQAVKFKAAIEELEEAKENREASIGIYVFAKGCEPTEVGDFRRVGEDFFCTVDKDQLEAGGPLTFFEVAYQIARALAVAAVRNGNAGTLDVQTLSDHVDALIKASERLSELSTKVSTIRNNGDAILKIAEGLKDELEARLTEMQGMLRAEVASSGSFG